MDPLHHVCERQPQENFGYWNEVGTPVDPLQHWLDTTNTADIMSRVSNTINDHPLGVRLLSSDELVPVTPNMLLLGRTGGSVQHHTEEETQEFSPRLAYQENLLQAWWSLWSH